MRRHMVGKELSRQWEIERKDAKRAEARLRLGLLRLEENWLYRMNMVAREQRQLQKELEKLRQGNSKKKFSSFSNDLLRTQKKPEIPTIPQQEGHRHWTAEPGGIRTMETRLLQTKKYEPSNPTQIASSHPINYTKNEEEASSQSSRGSGSLEGGPKAPKSSVTVINPFQDRDSINQPQEDISADLHNHGTLSKAEQVPDAPQVESEAIEIKASPSGGFGSKSGSGKQNHSPDREKSTFDPKAYTLYSYLRTVDTMPTYLELFAKIKNARYLRHRVPPEFERDLSIGEIFGHETCLPREGSKSDESLST
ncbi:coiled-coil domain-containing protein 190 isoform X2 [Monodelphis domestica]|uniref:coiled-coil domain-containing protein 190 isoform X2 n=1 Tax=Monodelphis domestica TaxID=13616 RepID=UPI00028BD755|nr:coiled-coil domain-containing protein 190 isoform X2 [Monodelphis domestica]